MSLQWGTPSTPDFPAQGKTTVGLEKTIGDNFVFAAFDVSFGAEGPGITEGQVLGFLQIIYDGYTNAGWNVTMQQIDDSVRDVEEV
jgi:hypothetical protein